MDSTSTRRVRRLFIVPAIGLILSGCGSAAPSTAGTTAVATAGPAAAAPADSPGGSQPVTPEPSDAATEAPGGNTSGDVPDNAVFLTYRGSAPGFSIQYVEGWQVTRQPAGVLIRDKDSSETVTMVAPQADVATYVQSTDLPSLQAQPGFVLIKQNTVKVGSSSYIHLVFHQISPPDSVTGKQVPQTVDRYYVPGPAALAIVSLATPDGVDNVDAFRTMIVSFAWL